MTFALLWHQPAEDTRLLSLDPHKRGVLYKMETKPRPFPSTSSDVRMSVDLIMI